MNKPQHKLISGADSKV